MKNKYIAPEIEVETIIEDSILEDSGNMYNVTQNNQTIVTPTTSTYPNETQFFNGLFD